MTFVVQSYFHFNDEICENWELQKLAMLNEYWKVLKIWKETQNSSQDCQHQITKKQKELVLRNHLTQPWPIHRKKINHSPCVNCNPCLRCCLHVVFLRVIKFHVLHILFPLKWLESFNVIDDKKNDFLKCEYCIYCNITLAIKNR